VKKKRGFFYIWLPPLGWSGLIFLLSSFPLTLKTQPPFIFIDKLAHFFIYIPLGFLVSRALWLGEIESLKKNFIIWTLIFCFLYGLSDEFHQLFVKNREASLWDALFDFLGSGVGLFIFNFFKKE
jgi:VanZ family protein